MVIIMEKKAISAKWIGIILAVVAIVAVAAVLLITRFAGKEETYRLIQIYQLEGKATIEREGIGPMDAVENLYLNSGDRICVGDGSSMRLKLDDDKYISVEENTSLTIVAEGTAEDSRTSIHVEQGAIISELQNKLNDNSSYDVITPNSVMAVRGTVFRVELVVDENGEIHTRVSTFQGTVESRIVSSDDNQKEIIVLVEGGKEVAIYIDEQEAAYFSDVEEIDYETMPVQTLEFVQQIAENGTSLVNVTPEEIKVLVEQMIEKLEESQATKQSESATEEQSETPQEAQQEKQAETQPEEVEETTGKQPATQTVQKQTTAEEATKTETPVEVQDTEEVQDTTDDSSDTDESNSTAPIIYTVTFTYNGSVFGTQTVEKGKTATCPKLAPAQSGSWNFDFTKAITGDTTIEWK